MFFYFRVDQENTSLLSQYQSEIGFSGEFTQYSSPSENPRFQELVNLGLTHMLGGLPLAIRREFAPSLLIQSLGGQVVEGHSVFRPTKGRYSHATNLDVLVASDLSTEEVLFHRQRQVNKVRGIYDDLLELTRGQYKIRPRNLPFGAGFLSKFPIYRKDRDNILRAAVIAGLMDSAEYREKAADHHLEVTGETLELGYGECVLVDTCKMQELGITTRHLSKSAHSTKALGLLRKLGILYDSIEDKEGLETAYIRIKSGLGICDDLGLIRIGHTLGVTPMVYGGFLTDGVDTYDKLIEEPVTGGLDEQIAREIQRKWLHKHGEAIVEDCEVLDVILYAAKALRNQPLRHSSSHRMLVQHTGTSRSSDPVIMSHAKFVHSGKQKNRFDLRSGPHKVSSGHLYDVAFQRRHFVRKHMHLPTPSRRAA